MRATGELAKRIAVAAVGIPAALYVLYLGGWALAILLALAAAAGALELYALAEARGLRPLRLPGAATAALLCLVAGARSVYAAAAHWYFGILIAYLLLLFLIVIWRRGVAGQPLLNASITFAGSVYAGLTLAFAMFLRHHDAAAGDARLGTFIVVFPLAVTWINDSAAYFAGRALGRHKLIPAVSPGKTVEGAAAGVIAGAATGAVYAALVLRPAGFPIAALSGALCGILLAALAQLGDLAESLFKREAGVKDSGTLLPGHGGVLDRFDALYFTLPAAYALVALLWAMGSAP